MPLPTTKTALLLPGLDALFSSSRLKRWMPLPEIQEKLDKASRKLSKLTGTSEDLYSFLNQHHRIHLIDFDRTLVCLTAVQVAIAERLQRLLNSWDLLQGCSHGDIARSVLCESISFDDAIEILWTFAELRQTCPPGQTANVRTLSGEPLLEAQIQWLVANQAPVSQWSDHHLTIGGTKEFISGLQSQAQEHGLKIKPVLPYPIHSPAMEPSFRDLLRQASRWTIHPPNQPVFSSLWLRYLTTGEEVFTEGLAGSTSPVRWMETLEALYKNENVRKFINVGPSNALTGWLLSSPKYPDIQVVESWDLAGEQFLADGEP
ncbi:MAG: ACP S-malonyltransferase [Bdellovibrionales bacterium]|nr:ACP S-malonyltransferase [Bdellovibrionales bacterium]